MARRSASVSAEEATGDAKSVNADGEAPEKVTEEPTESDIVAGHSSHGEAFNEGRAKSPT